jgi:Putative Ig domain
VAKSAIRSLLLVIGTFGLLLFVACGGQQPSVVTSSSSITSLVVACNPTQLQAGQTAQCAVTVIGTGNFNRDVTWSVGNSPGVGTISSTGLYTSPQSVPSKTTVQLIATSVQDTSQSASKNLDVAPPPPIAVSVSPAVANLVLNQTQQFTATVTNTAVKDVTWQVGHITGGNAALGIIDATGFYAAPSALPNSPQVRIQAVSVADPTKFGEAVVSLSLVASNDLAVQDIFGRLLNTHGLVLVDRDGYMANPAIKFYVVPPANAVFPATAVVSADNQRYAFDLPSTWGASGPTKTLSFTDASPVPVYLSNLPDRDTADKNQTLAINFTDAGSVNTVLTLPIHEINQRKNTPPLFNIIPDYSQDQTGFFADPDKRAVFEQASKDWAYFVDDMNLDPIPANWEWTYIWSSSGFTGGNWVMNANAYTGFLLYGYGIDAPPYVSGGEPSINSCQTSGGNPLPFCLRLSGGQENETRGNYNTLGWLLGTDPNLWWVSGNLSNEQNELFSIEHHEMGHALWAHPAHSKWNDFKTAGKVDDPIVVAYHGSAPKIDAWDHLSGEIDNESLKGAFGYEYYGSMPTRRWMITKLDLLVMQAVGYKLRPTSAVVALSILTTNLPGATSNSSYSATLQAEGGIPFYEWTVDSGTLPEGLALDSFSGTISGTPTASGTSNFTIRVKDYLEGGTGVTAPLSITVQ